ncbi:hypothetical protein G3O08_01545 [Cryomorpha ignava]|uniref:WG repeat-containing protein n=1 Tax=Cryomorpha ignava TaxID=101383 RepID=A0A7K3WKL3_9FLAO|nr:WG repeat-containing protein [Cryomorpha ignava]NEN22186.1 hypothetical protein [Cryomorpha ignava]
MKYAIRTVAFFFTILVFGAFVSAPLSGKLKRGFAALKEYNYFEAKKQFYKALKRDSVAAGYGLSVIYGRDDNPFYQIDSAFKFITLAATKYPELEAKTKADYTELGIDSMAISRQVNHVDSLFYNAASAKNTLSAWQYFVDFHKSQPYYDDAIEKRNEIAFHLAADTNTSAAYRNYVDQYPDADQIFEAGKRYNRLLYEEQTKEGRVLDFQRFIEENPESPYVSDAEYRVYEKATAPGTLEVYRQFIAENPTNENVNRAWRNIYALEVGELSARSIAAFSMRYPDYPFSDELKTDFQLATTRFYPIQENGLWGFIDDKGEVRIEPAYEWVEPFSESLASVGKNEKVAFINKAGQLITKFDFEDAYAFRSGYSVVVKNDLYGVINRLGKWIAEPVYQDVGEFSEGFFYAENEAGYGYLDENGNKVIDFYFENATDFKNGLAIVQKDGKYGIINTHGELISDFEYDWIEPFRTDRNPSRFKKGDLFGLVDQVGAVVVDSEYTHIGDFSEGLALAANNKTYGFINTKGDTIIDFKYTFSPAVLKFSTFQNGYVRIYQKDKVGVIDTADTKIFPAIFENIGEFSGKLIPVVKKDKWGYADLNVNLAIPYKFDEVGNFHDSVAVVSKNGLFGLIDTLGRTKVDFKYKSIVLIDSLMLVSDTAYGLIDMNENILVPFIYSNAEVIDKYIIRFENGENQGGDYYDLSQRKFLWRRKS